MTKLNTKAVLLQEFYSSSPDDELFHLLSPAVCSSHVPLLHHGRGLDFGSILCYQLSPKQKTITRNVLVVIPPVSHLFKLMLDIKQKYMYFALSVKISVLRFINNSTLMFPIWKRLNVWTPSVSLIKSLSQTQVFSSLCLIFTLSGIKKSKYPEKTQGKKIHSACMLQETLEERYYAGGQELMKIVVPTCVITEQKINHLCI